MFVIQRKEMVERRREYVFKFNSSHQVITRTFVAPAAKQFKTEQAASKFIAKYSDAGYGFTGSEWEIVQAK